MNRGEIGPTSNSHETCDEPINCSRAPGLAAKRLAVQHLTYAQEHPLTGKDSAVALGDYAIPAQTDFMPNTQARTTCGYPSDQSNQDNFEGHDDEHSRAGCGGD